MPAITTILMAAGTAYQAIQAVNQKAQADNAIAQAAINAGRISQGGVNKLASLKVPTLGTQLAQQNIQTRQASDIQALKDIGAAGVLGGLTATNLQAQQEDLQLAANADQMAYQRDLAVQQQEQALADAQLNRDYQLEMNRLQGAQTASAANQSAINQSIGNAAQIFGDLDTMKIYKGQEPLKLFGKGNALIKTGGKDAVANAVSAVGKDMRYIDPFSAVINPLPVGLTNNSAYNTFRS